MSDVDDAGPSSATKTRFRGFKNKDAEEELLRAIRDRSPLNARYGEKQKRWQQVYEDLKNNDTRRSSQWYHGLSVRSCQIRWSVLAKEYEDQLKASKRPDWVHQPAHNPRLELLKELYDVDQGTAKDGVYSNETPQAKPTKRQWQHDVNDILEAGERERSQESTDTDDNGATVAGSANVSGKRMKMMTLHDQLSDVVEVWKEQLEHQKEWTAIQREQAATRQEIAAVLHETKEALREQKEALREQKEALREQKEVNKALVDVLGALCRKLP
ncbi:hypothetical protein BGZ65_000500 [Modicella reniformis]|uniref:Uncharacterized protein n=1 Tax=Modicella reniformis TaxID=1440133 RepID=A0A9P6MAC3_9FUNG|nr:hypothetical protein BGZ65_000500 [Modicella reniformis]